MGDRWTKDEIERMQCHRFLAASGCDTVDSYEQVETSRVLLFVFAVLIFVICLELFLHFLEHATKRKKKYAEMLHKTTQELMIVGLIYLLVKFCITTGIAKKNGPVYQAMDFADLLILFTVLAMVLQAIVILFRLRINNRELGKALILPTDYVVKNAKDGIKAAENRFFLFRYLAWTRYRYVLHIKLLRSLFIKTYDLPQLFPFDKYIEDVQDHQVASLVEIDITIWVLIMAAYALFFIFSGELFNGGAFKANTEIRWGIFACFSYSLFVLMVLLLIYLRKSLELLLRYAAQQADVLGTRWNKRRMNNPISMFQALDHVVENEQNMPRISTQQSIEQMQRIAEELSDNHGHHHQSGGLAHLFEHDLLCQLLASCCRRIRGQKYLKKGKLERKISLELPYFSRKLVHFVIQLLFIMNGFYYALFINCVMYVDGFTIQAVLKGLIECLPLVVNTYFLAPKITREFSVINGVFRVDGNKLSGIVEHFAQVEATKIEMVKQVRGYLQHHNKKVDDIKEALARVDETNDDANDGYIDMDVLRGVLKQYGFRFQRQKFVTFVRIQFETKGRTIRYADLIHLFEDEQPQDHVMTHSLAPTASNYSFQQGYPMEIQKEAPSRSTLITDSYFV